MYTVSSSGTYTTVLLNIIDFLCKQISGTFACINSHQMEHRNADAATDTVSPLRELLYGFNRKSTTVTYVQYVYGPRPL